MTVNERTPSNPNNRKEPLPRRHVEAKQRLQERKSRIFRFFERRRHRRRGGGQTIDCSAVNAIPSDDDSRSARCDDRITPLFETVQESDFENVFKFRFIARRFVINNRIFLVFAPKESCFRFHENANSRKKRSFPVIICVRAHFPKPPISLPTNVQSV